jgi:hypothetical protein
MDSPNHSGHFRLFSFCSEAILTSPAAKQCILHFQILLIPAGCVTESFQFAFD